MLDLTKPMQTRNGQYTARYLGPIRGERGEEVAAFALAFKGGSPEESLVKRMPDGTAPNSHRDIVNVPDFALADVTFIGLSSDLRAVILGLAKNSLTLAVHVLKQARPDFHQPEEYLAWKLSQS